MGSATSGNLGNYGDQSNLPWQWETDTGEKALENADLGGWSDGVMGDWIDVVSDDLLQIREDQVQRAKLRDEKEKVEKKRTF